MGRDFGGGLYEREARFLIAEEWAITAQDILTRRTKHGLHMSAAEQGDFCVMDPRGGLMRDISSDQEFLALRAMSAHFGRDRLRTQAAGGNTSIKRDDAMWIKASGFWLSDAADKDIFVPVALDGLRAAVLRNDPAADSAASFVIGELNPTGLRPSIETSVHAIRTHAVVSHIHCVETIALAVRSDGSNRIADRLRHLEGVRWSFVPYRRPGLPSARAILEFASPEANVLILGNHGLVVSGETAQDFFRRFSRASAKSRRSPIKG